MRSSRRIEQYKREFNRATPAEIIGSLLGMFNAKPNEELQDDMLEALHAVALDKPSLAADICRGLAPSGDRHLVRIFMEMLEALWLNGDKSLITKLIRQAHSHRATVQLVDYMRESYITGETEITVSLELITFLRRMHL